MEPRWNDGMVETGNPLVADAACGAGLSGAKRARRILEYWGTSQEHRVL
jgi:hypothetical protein